MAKDSGISLSEAVYAALHKPALNKDAPFRTGHACGVCARAVPTTPATKILTSRFGSWEDITIDPHDGNRWLCKPCAWLYRAPHLRRDAFVVTDRPTFRTVTPREARDLLDGPIPGTTAIVVPTSGKRIVAPRARWGTLTTDHGSIRWTRSHHRLLTVATQLRGLGASEGALALPAPPWPLLRDLPPTDHGDVAALWRAFSPAREDKSMLPLYQRLSREAA